MFQEEGTRERKFQRLEARGLPLVLGRDEGGLRTKVQPRPRRRAVPGARGLTTHAVEAILFWTRTGSLPVICSVGAGLDARRKKRKRKLRILRDLSGVGFRPGITNCHQEVDDSSSTASRAGDDRKSDPIDKGTREADLMSTDPSEKSLRLGMGVCTQCSG